MNIKEKKNITMVSYKWFQKIIKSYNNPKKRLAILIKKELDNPNDIIKISILNKVNYYMEKEESIDISLKDLIEIILK